MPNRKPKKWIPERRGSFFSVAFIPAIGLGLRDAFNPRFLTAFLIFFLILILFQNRKKYVKWFGLTYIVSFIIFIFAELIGLSDWLVSIAGFLKIVNMVNTALAIVFIFLGIIHFLDWFDFQKNGNVERFKLKRPFYFQITGDEKKEMYFPVLSGLILMSLASFSVYLSGLYWPSDYYLNLMFYFGLYQGQLKLTLLSFLLYAVSVSLPMIFLWYFLLKCRNISTDKAKISVLKVILAALFLSTGIGILYTILI